MEPFQRFPSARARASSRETVEIETVLLHPAPHHTPINGGVDEISGLSNRHSVSNLLYRRASRPQCVEYPPIVGFSRRLPIGDRRYSRLETCATIGQHAREHAHRFLP